MVGIRGAAYKPSFNSMLDTWMQTQRLMGKLLPGCIFKCPFARIIEWLSRVATRGRFPEGKVQANPGFCCPIRDQK